MQLFVNFARFSILGKQSMKEDHSRMESHRNKFCHDRFDKSALSMHLYYGHPYHIYICNGSNEGLVELRCGIVGNKPPMQLI